MRKQSLRSKLLDMLFPPRCIFCNEIVPIGSCICKKCDDKIFLLDDIQTAKVENESFHGICVAPYLYEDKIQELIVNFKFYHKPHMVLSLVTNWRKLFVIKEWNLCVKLWSVFPFPKNV